MTTGRNDPCPCGSGTKYKRCCLIGKPTLMARTVQLSISINTDEEAEVVARRVRQALAERTLGLVVVAVLVEGAPAVAYWANAAAAMRRNHPDHRQDDATRFAARTVAVTAFALTTASALDLGALGNRVGRGPLRRMTVCGVAKVDDERADALWRAVHEGRLGEVGAAGPAS